MGILTVNTDPYKLWGDDYKPEVDYSTQYLTFEAIDDCVLSFTILWQMNTDMIKSISYSTDGGATWTTTNNVDDKEKNLVITVELNAGDKVLWKGDATQTGIYNDEYFEHGYGGSYFWTISVGNTNGRVNVYGNVMSLLYRDDFVDKTNLNDVSAIFASLFYGYDDEEGAQMANIVSAEHLILPATGLSEYCYAHMFMSNVYLTTAPELIAAELVSGCYDGMFYMCENLNYIKAMFITKPDRSYTDNWVYGVAANGTFVKNASATWNVTGTNGVPQGWTIETV